MCLSPKRTVDQYASRPKFFSKYRDNLVYVLPGLLLEHLDLGYLLLLTLSPVINKALFNHHCSNGTGYGVIVGLAVAALTKIAWLL